MLLNAHKQRLLEVIKMTVGEMRIAIKNAPKYKDSDTWKYKVDNMHDNQVMAVYFRLKKAGEI